MTGHSYAPARVLRAGRNRPARLKKLANCESKAWYPPLTVTAAAAVILENVLCASVAGDDMVMPQEKQKRFPGSSTFLQPVHVYRHTLTSSEATKHIKHKNKQNTHTRHAHKCNENLTVATRKDTPDCWTSCC